MELLMERSWLEKLGPEFEKGYMRDLERFLAREVKERVVYPPMGEVFAAFCGRFEEVKVVIIGQDPYHGAGQAHGLCFSVRKGVPVPPSLQNIYKELRDDVGLRVPEHGCLEGWARQGVLLLNATLTVREGEPKSHYGKGWEVFTDRVVSVLAEREDPLVFVLWGRSALEKWEKAGGSGRHLVLKAPHPSPLSAHAGFLGCRHFSQINAFLEKMGRGRIDWAV